MQLKVTMQSVRTKQTVRVQLLASQRVVEGPQGRLAKQRLFRCVAEAGHRKPQYCFAAMHVSKQWLAVATAGLSGVV